MNSEEQSERPVIVNDYWSLGQRPAQCTGSCDISDCFLFDFCNTCCWNNGGTGVAPGEQEFKI